jgi:hypothetical protein
VTSIYIATHPLASSQQVLEHLASRPGGREKAADAAKEAQHFSASDRFFHAMYKIQALMRVVRNYNTAPLALLKKYNVEEKQIHLDSTKHPDIKNQGLTSQIMHLIDSADLRGSHGTLVLSIQGETSAHTITLCVDPEQQKYVLYDSEFGWHQYPDRETFNLQFKAYLKAIWSDMKAFNINAYIPK